MPRMLDYDARSPRPRRFPLFFAALGLVAGFLFCIAADLLGLWIVPHTLAYPVAALLFAVLPAEVENSLGPNNRALIASTIAWYSWGIAGALIGLAWSLLSRPPASKSRQEIVGE